MTERSDEQYDDEEEYSIYEEEDGQSITGEELQEMDEEDVFPEFRCVAGYRNDEPELEPTYDRSGYTNWEINEHLESYFRFFGSNDMEIIYLYFLSRKRQEEIMTILGKSQPAVSYDVTRIREQMQFVVRILSMLDDFIMFITDPANKMRTDDKEMLTIFFYSTSIVKTSRILGINNITCRSHLNTLINRLKAQGHTEMYEMFRYIMTNLNHIKKSIPKTDAPQDEND